jgi:hypothetical protein
MSVAQSRRRAVAMIPRSRQPITRSPRPDDQFLVSAPLGVGVPVDTVFVATIAHFTAGGRIINSVIGALIASVVAAILIWRGSRRPL